MKKLLASLLALSLFVSLAACGGSASQAGGTGDAGAEVGAAEAGAGAGDEGKGDEAPASGAAPGEYVGFDGVDTEIEAEITIYRHYADADKVDMDAAVAKMQAKYPGLTITIEHRADSDGTALKTWAAVGELPDIFENTAIDAYQSMLDNGDIYPLDEAIAATGFYDLFTNGEVTQAGHTNEDGHQYSMACEVNHVLCFWYNKTLFEELGISEPTDYEEFKHTITVLKDAGKIPIALFGAEQWPAMAIYSTAVVAEGEYEGVDAINFGRATFEDEAFVRAAEKMEEIVGLGAFGAGALSTNYQQATELLATGEAGYFVSGSWYWLTTESEGYADNMDWVNYNPFADEDKAEEALGRCVGGLIKEQQYSVNANPPSGLDPYVVALLLCEFEYYTRENSALSGSMTTVKGDFAFGGAEGYADFNESYGSFKSFNTLPGDMTDPQLVNYLGNAMEMMVSGNYTAEEFLQEMKDCGY